MLTERFAFHESSQPYPTNLILSLSIRSKRDAATRHTLRPFTRGLGCLDSDKQLWCLDSVVREEQAGSEHSVPLFPPWIGLGIDRFAFVRCRRSKGGGL